MSVESDAASQRRKRWLAIVASEADRGLAREVGAALGERVQIDILFLDSAGSAGQLEHLLPMLEACLFFLSPAIEEFPDAVETAIRFHHGFSRPALIAILMGTYQGAQARAFGDVMSFRVFRWRDSRNTTDLIGDLSTSLDTMARPETELLQARPRSASQRSSAPQLESIESARAMPRCEEPRMRQASPPRPLLRIHPFQRMFGWVRRQAARWEIQPSADLPAGRVVDNVNLSLTAPASLRIGGVHELRFWAHLEAQTSTVVARALAALAVLDPRKLLIKTEGPFHVARGTELEIAVSIEDLILPDRSKLIMWTGEIGCAAFLVKVPAPCSVGPKPGSASVRVAGIEIAKISFVLQVGAGSPKARRVQTGIKRHTTAFASYASEDRDAVLARIQGIQKVAPSLKVFVDVMSLHSGDDWQRRLQQAIAKTDVFYLFWCRHARQSAWVEKEWRCAVQLKGVDFIDPVPLESPDFAPPPAELSMKHFNEPILAFITSDSHPPPRAKSFHGR